MTAKVNLNRIQSNLIKEYPKQMANPLFACYLTSKIRIDKFAELRKELLEERLSVVHDADSANFRELLSNYKD